MNYRFFSQVIIAIGILALTNLSSYAAGAPGLVFTPQKPLNSYAAMDSGAGNQINPKIASDGEQTLVAAWNTAISNDPLDMVQTDVVVAVSEDSGATWSAPETLYGGEATLALITHTGSDWVAMWYNNTPSTDTTSFSLNLYSARSTDGVSWAEPELLYRGYGFFKEAESDGEETIIVTLGPMTIRLPDDTIVSTDAQIVRSIDGGQSWSSYFIPSEGIDHYSDEYQIAAAGDGKWYRLLDQDVGASLLYTSTDNGATWSEPVQAEVLVDVSDDLQLRESIRAGDLAARGDTIVAVSFPGIYVSVDGGITWTGDPRGVDFAVPQDVAVDSSGNWLIATQDYGEITEDYPYPKPENQHVTISTSSDPAAGWTSPVNVTTSGTRTENPAVQPLGDGGFAVVYQSYTKDEGALTTDADIAVTVKADAGSSWTQPVQVNPALAAEFPYIDDKNVLLEAGDNGTVLAVWEANSDSASGADQVMVARSTNYGINWSETIGITPLAESGGIFKPHLVYAGSGRWLISYGIADGYEYIMSDDDGLTWSTPANLNAPEVAANGNGTIIKFNQTWSWTVIEPSEVVLTTGPISLSRLPRNSHTWEEPVVLPEADWSASVVLLANTSGQNWCLIVRGEPYQVFTSTDDGRTWALQAGTNLPQSARFDIDDNGNIVAIDARDKSAFDASIYVSRSTNNGVNWSTPSFLAKVPTGDIVVRPEFIYGDIVHFGSSIWVIGLNISEYALSADGGITWSGLASYPFGEIGIKSRPAMAAKHNRILFAWQQNETDLQNSDSDIYYSQGSYGVVTAAQDWQLYE